MSQLFLERLVCQYVFQAQKLLKLHGVPGFESYWCSHYALEEFKQIRQWYVQHHTGSGGEWRARARRTRSRKSSGPDMSGPNKLAELDLMVEVHSGKPV